MVKTQKLYIKKNVSKKNLKSVDCPISLKPFEEEFNKKIPKNQLKKTSSEKTKAFVKQLLSKFAPHSIKPENDFYDYINYQWIKDVSLENQQKYITQIDDFRLTQHQVYEELNGIILDYIKTHDDKLSKNLKNFYNSVIKTNPKDYTRRLAKEAVKTIDDLIAENNPWKMLAFFNKDEMIAHKAPFVWSLNPDEKNAQVYSSYITPHQFTILDVTVYYDDGKDVEYKNKYRKEFKKSCQKIFNTLLGPNEFNGKDIFDVEVDILNAFLCTTDLTAKEDEESYNKIHGNEALSKYGFDWKEFSHQLDFKQMPATFITTSKKYLKCGCDIFLQNWNTPKWRSYWIWILLSRLARITSGYEKLNYEFSGKFERGQEQINKADAVSASLYMSVPFNTFLTNEYVKKYENSQALQYVKTMCDDIKIVYKKILTRNSWLQPSTKAYALKKLEHFNFVYGKPEGLREDPDLNYGTILYDNMQKITEWRHSKFIELNGKPTIDIPIMDWSLYPVKMVGTQAYIVNASYTPSKNSIYINSGYIQKPFIDLDERGIEYNLAHIGYTIGHELSHAFDDTGSKYGWDGNLNDWWTDTDKKKYKLIQKDVIKQYEEFAARDGIKFDASIGIGEDLADISGLAICDEYLRDFQDKNSDLIPIRYLSYEAFYTYFAFQNRQVVTKKALAAQLKTNPHPLDKYRTNIPLSRSKIFRALYNVKQGDGMWWHNTDTIW
jgi:predicted metalloendopeptidase